MNKNDNLRKKVVEKSLAVSMVLAIVSSLVYTLVDMLEMLQRRGYDFVATTFRYNLITLLSTSVSIIPAGVSGIMLGFWIWMDFDRNSFSRKRAIQKGLFVGTLAGILSAAIMIYNSTERLDLPSFHGELITGLILWIISGGLTGWLISNFIEKHKNVP